jgi:hypothetical protein
MKILYVILSAVLLAGCGPSAEQLTATAVMAQAQTQTAAPTKTPTPEPTATRTPSRTPMPSSTATNTPEPATVYGNLQIGFIPYNEKAVAPKPPIDVTLVLEQAAGGGIQTRHNITDQSGGFSLALAPGDYLISLLEIKASSLSSKTIKLPVNGPYFTVPETGCAYVGRIFYFYYRLPPGSMEEIKPLIQEIANKANKADQSIYFIFLNTGALVPESVGADLPDENKRVQGAENCVEQVASFSTK